MWIGWKCTRERPCQLGWWQSNEDASLFKELVEEGCPGTSGGEKEPSPVGIGIFSVPVPKLGGRGCTERPKLGAADSGPDQAHEDARSGRYNSRSTETGCKG